MTDIQELAERLCVAAGMIMEDVVDIAILRGELDLPSRASQIASAGRDVRALADAAQALLRRC